MIICEKWDLRRLSRVALLTLTRGDRLWEEQVKKTAARIAVFVLGAVLLLFGLQRGHRETLTLQNNPNNPNTPATSFAPELLAMGGVFLMLGAFAPSPGRLGRWLTRKPRRPVPHTRFRRQHKN